jgi:hypothetical protein
MVQNDDKQGKVTFIKKVVHDITKPHLHHKTLTRTHYQNLLMTHWQRKEIGYQTFQTTFQSI